MRKVWVGVAAAVAVAGLAATGLLIARSAPEAPQEQQAPRSTAEVVRGDLAEQTLVQGSLGHVGTRTLSGGPGTVTSLAPEGSTVSVGGELYAIDNVPVTLMTGALPQWRAFSLGMEDGPDVQQLEASLGALGFFWADADEVFDADTELGIKLWQEAQGRDKTGEIALGEISFAPGPLRVASAKLEIGAQAAQGAEILTVTELGKSVTVDLKLAQQQLATLGASVLLELPGGTKTTGTITGIDPPREPEDGGGTGDSGTVVPVTVTLDTPEDAADLDRATVRVSFTSETRTDVLSVPIGALLALPEGGYGVEVLTKGSTTPKLVPVETGLFAGGRVEISGDGVTEGTTVVVAES